MRSLLRGRRPVMAGLDPDRQRLAAPRLAGPDLLTLALCGIVLAGAGAARAEPATAHAVAADEEQAAPKAAPQPAGAGPTRDQALSADMERQLRKAGFTDLEILPNSILVRARDKAGNPVAMVLNPHSMTEMVTLDPHSGPAAGGTGAGQPLTGSGTFATILPSEKLASALIGIAVRDPAGKQLGTIKDIAIDHGGVNAYIVGVGGIIGIGVRYVAVTPAALDLAYDRDAKSYRATMKATLEQLRSAPEFLFKDASEAKRD